MGVSRGTTPRAMGLLARVERLLGNLGGGAAEDGLEAEEADVAAVHAALGASFGYDDGDSALSYDYEAEAGQAGAGAGMGAGGAERAGESSELSSSSSSSSGREQDSDLFSLQVYVEEAEIEDAAERARAGSLGVAFRVLDFPALLIRAPGDGDGASVAATAGGGPGVLSFEAGKSCLFRMPAARAARLLARAPLYLMLVRPWKRRRGEPENDAQALERAVLLGSASLDLSGLCGLDAALGDVVLPQPASRWGWRRGMFPLFDLMGRRVASLTVRVRLCNFGDGLLPHLVSGEGEGLETELRSVALPDEEDDGRVEERGGGAVSATILQAMRKLENKIDRLEGRLAPPHARGWGRLEAPAAPPPGAVEGPSGGALPRPGQGEGVALPPPLYYKRKPGESDSESDSENRDRNARSGRDVAVGGDGEQDWARFKGLPSKRGLPRAARPRLIRIDGDSQGRGGEDSDDGAPSPPPSPPRAPQSPQRPVLPRPNKLRVRTTRAQTMRERANRRRFGDDAAPVLEDQQLASALAAELAGSSSRPRQEALTRSALSSRSLPIPSVAAAAAAATATVAAAAAAAYAAAAAADAVASAPAAGPAPFPTMTPAQVPGMVRIAADLGKARPLEERDVEERKHLFAARQRRRDEDAGRMQLSALVKATAVGPSAAPRDSGEGWAMSSPGAEQEQRVRSAQLAAIWQGRMAPRPAYDRATAAAERAASVNSAVARAAAAAADAAAARAGLQPEGPGLPVVDDTLLPFVEGSTDGNEHERWVMEQLHPQARQAVEEDEIATFEEEAWVTTPKALKAVAAKAPAFAFASASASASPTATATATAAAGKDSRLAAPPPAEAAEAAVAPAPALAAAALARSEAPSVSSSLAASAYASAVSLPASLSKAPSTAIARLASSNGGGPDNSPMTVDELGRMSESPRSRSRAAHALSEQRRQREEQLARLRQTQAQLQANQAARRQRAALAANRRRGVGGSGGGAFGGRRSGLASANDDTFVINSLPEPDLAASGFSGGRSRYHAFDAAQAAQAATQSSRTSTASLPPGTPRR